MSCNAMLCGRSAVGVRLRTTLTGMEGITSVSGVLYNTQRKSDNVEGEHGVEVGS